MDTVDVTLVHILEDIRCHFGLPVIPSSGNRCYQHNLDEGGGADSQHLLSKAADIDVVGVGASRVQDYFNERWLKQHGMGRYKSFTHVDSRDIYGRW